MLIRDPWELLTIIVPQCFDSAIFHGPIWTHPRPSDCPAGRKGESISEWTTDMVRPNEYHHCRSRFYAKRKKNLLLTILDSNPAVRNSGLSINLYLHTHKSHRLFYRQIALFFVFLNKYFRNLFLKL